MLSPFAYGADLLSAFQPRRVSILGFVPKRKAMVLHGFNKEYVFRVVP